MKKLFLIPLFCFTTAFLCDSGDEAPAEDPFVGSPADTVEVAPTPEPDAPRFNDPKRKGKPGPASIEVEPVPAEPEGRDFCRQGTACDVAGDGRLARLVNPSTSTFQIVQLKHYSPGDEVAFVLCAFDTEGEPVVGVPATVRVKQTSRLLAGDGLTLTGENGCVVAEGVVTAEDLHPGPGSYIVNGYLGGRLLNQVRVLPDSL